MVSNFKDCETSALDFEKSKRRRQALDLELFEDNVVIGYAFLKETEVDLSKV